MINNLKRAGTIFITGLSASGKSTTGKLLEENLIKIGVTNIVLLDGEDIREQLAKRGKRYGYSQDDRNEVALQIAQIAKEYNQRGVICIICSICHLKHIRQKMCEIIGNVWEVYLDCSVATCAKRDYKGNYEKAFYGEYENFVGVTEPYQTYPEVDLVLPTGKMSVTDCSKLLFESVSSFLDRFTTCEEVNA